MEWERKNGVTNFKMTLLFGLFFNVLAKFSQKHDYFDYRMVSYAVFNGPQQIRKVNYVQ